jgi:histidinol-phosphate aminotransferase
MFSSRLNNLVPYVPGEQPQDRSYVKLNTNENPYPPSPRIEPFLKEFGIDRLRLYHDPTFDTLREALAKRYGVAKDQVFVGNGSDEVLSFVFYAFFDRDHGKLLFPEFTYSFYPVYCQYYDIDFERIPLADDFSVRVDGFLDAEPSTGVIFPNPNAPTGMELASDEVGRLLECYPRDRLIAIDEAYVAFGGTSAIPLVDANPNLLIIRTFSKSMSLAGLRLGYAIGNKKLIDALYAVKDSFNSYPVDTLAQKIGEIAIQDASYYNKITSRIIDNRDTLEAALKERGWQVLPSKANFVFVRKNGVPGNQIYSMLKDRGILVRYFDIDGIKDFVRITIGTRESIDLLIAALDSISAAT